MTQHPNLHLIDVRCSTCRASFGIRSTAEAISVEVCSNCHPAYTGRARTVSGGGQGRPLQPPPRSFRYLGRVQKPVDRLPSPVTLVRVGLAVFVLAWIFGPYALPSAVPIWLPFLIALGLELHFFVGAHREADAAVVFAELLGEEARKRHAGLA